MEVKSTMFPSLSCCREGSDADSVHAACVADASMYAHYLFNAFDTANNGSIKFKVKEKKVMKNDLLLSADSI